MKYGRLIHGLTVLVTCCPSGLASAGADLQIDYALRAVDFSKFTPNSNLALGYGPGISAVSRYRPANGPFGVGFFYAEHQFSLDPSRHYYDSLHVREFGLAAALSLTDKDLIPEISCSYLITGAVEATTNESSVYRLSDASGLVTSGETKWTYQLRGAHVTPGLRWEIGKADKGYKKGGSLVFGIDFGMQVATLVSVNERGHTNEAAQDYARRRNAFDSIGIIIGARAQP